MKTFTLRTISLRADNTFGVLLDGDLPFCVTVERPWLNNAKGVSCIPAGVYLCKRVNSPKFGNTFEVTGVPNRDAILLHKGNLASDSHGCIILGEAFDPIKGEDGVAHSGDAFAEFLRRTTGLDEFTLNVIR